MANSATDKSPTPDAAAAHEFLSELRTRIATQPLPYQYGIETAAFQSLRDVFDHARAAMKKYPGCDEFARVVTHMLNVELRPFTAKWHRAASEGRLASRDGADEFRGELTVVRRGLRSFAERLQTMAYGESKPDEPTPEVMSADELSLLFKPVRFGIGSQYDDVPRDAINTSEAEEVSKRRKHYKITTADGTDAVGLALSGGGIRSATFSLGVTQVLAELKLLKDVDFLSTVSGGGYTGSFLTTRLGKGDAASDGREYERVARPHGPDTNEIRYLRRHAKYLAGINLKQSWLMVTATLAGLILNWTAPLLVVALAALAASYTLANAEWLFSAVLISLGLTGAALISYAGLIRYGEGHGQVGGAVLAGLAALTVLLGGFLLLVVGHHVFTNLTPALPAMPNLPGGAGLVSGLILAGPAILRFVPVLKRPAVRRLVLKLLLIAAGLIIPAGAITLFYVFWWLSTLPLDPNSPLSNPLHYGDGRLVLTVIVAVLAFVAFVLLNINLTAPHRLYRDQLAGTFVQDCDKPVVVALKDINPNGSAPYHLINAAVNLPTSQHRALRERKSDFFLFSKHWCGSPATRYFRTKEWRTNGDDADLATAMAISGGAVSSHMGLRSISLLTSLLTFLNIRLGFWIHRPTKKAFLEAPAFFCLMREMTGIAMSEERQWLNLSDGGHLENMGVYELLRRRCKFIICVDGEADPEATFVGFMTMVRHAQIDFGIVIDAKLDELRPTESHPYGRSHATLCRVHYPGDDEANLPAGTGMLLYLKLSLTGNEPELIRRYRAIHPEFPHESTLDQFFDEEQFEAYRQLGIHVAEALFLPAVTSGNVQPESVADWFWSLACNLLEPRMEHVWPEPRSRPIV